MTLRPCMECGAPGENTRCPEHAREFGKRETRKNVAHVAYKNLSRWKNLSKRMRRRQPWCDVCGTDQRLQTNHIISVHERPDLTYNEANISILCDVHNGQRHDDCTDDERAEVLRRIAQRKSRRHAATRGEGVTPALSPMPGEARRQLRMVPKSGVGL